MNIAVPAQVYVTGHSLGGSLANLAAYDIARALEHCPHMTRIICYTFGSPRTGNHAFARDYQRVVPDTWSIINDQACCVPYVEHATVIPRMTDSNGVARHDGNAYMFNPRILYSM